MAAGSGIALFWHLLLVIAVKVRAAQRQRVMTDSEFCANDHYRHSPHTRAGAADQPSLCIITLDEADCENKLRISCHLLVSSRRRGRRSSLFAKMQTRSQYKTIPTCSVACCWKCEAHHRWSSIALYRTIFTLRGS